MLVTQTLTRGSAGGQDPYIGSYELPQGRYFIAVTNSAMAPEALATYTDPNSTSPLVRLQPIEGVRLIAEDHIESQGGSTAVAPVTPVLFPVAGTFNPVTGTVYTTADDAIVDYGLGDIKLVHQPGCGPRTDQYLHLQPADWSVPESSWPRSQ